MPAGQQSSGCSHQWGGNRKSSWSQTFVMAQVVSNTSQSPPEHNWCVTTQTTCHPGPGACQWSQPSLPSGIRVRYEWSAEPTPYLVSGIRYWISITLTLKICFNARVSVIVLAGHPDVCVIITVNILQYQAVWWLAILIMILSLALKQDIAVQCCEDLKCRIRVGKESHFIGC